jgi:hypothetical protein
VHALRPNTKALVHARAGGSSRQPSAACRTEGFDPTQTLTRLIQLLRSGRTDPATSSP